MGSTTPARSHFGSARTLNQARSRPELASSGSGAHWSYTTDCTGLRSPADTFSHGVPCFLAPWQNIVDVSVAKIVPEKTQSLQGALSVLNILADCGFQYLKIPFLSSICVSSHLAPDREVTAGGVISSSRSTSITTYPPLCSTSS